MLDISVTIGASVFRTNSIAYTSGLSVLFLQHPSSKIGLSFNPLKISCAECNTPVAEVTAGSLIIRSKHHGSRHVTAFSKESLIDILNI